MSDTNRQSDFEVAKLTAARKPPWLKRPVAFQGKQHQVNGYIAASGLHTVCSEARCPNRSECFSRGTATFLVMGSVCTRICTFCSVIKGSPCAIDWSEIERVVTASRSMKLRHVVITSVTRDDLSDGGASFFREMVAAFRRDLPGVTVELLIPDLQGDEQALAEVFRSRPDILNHNIETVPSLYAAIRPRADYHRSLAVLRSAADAGLVVKSGMMVGLGERQPEVNTVLDDLKKNGCSVVTIGQYLQPTPQQAGVVEYIAPDLFKEYARYGESAGILQVIAGPFVRSSYRASEIIDNLPV